MSPTYDRMIVPTIATAFALLGCVSSDDDPNDSSDAGRNSSTANSNGAGGSVSAGGKSAGSNSADGGPNGSLGAADASNDGSLGASDDGGLLNGGNDAAGNAGGVGNTNTGTGTLTIGDESWTITQIWCVFSAEEARNPDFPFNLSGFGESSSGARSQLTADIYDPTGQERLAGDGVTHGIAFDDIEDFENPSVSWSTIEGVLANDAMTLITIDGKNIHGEGVFDDKLTELEIENVPGTLDVSCL